VFVKKHALWLWLGGVDVDSNDNDAVGFSLQYLHAGLAGRYVKLLGGSGLLQGLSCTHDRSLGNVIPKNAFAAEIWLCDSTLSVPLLVPSRSSSCTSLSLSARVSRFFAHAYS
jgi:hypothetical protein